MNKVSGEVPLTEAEIVVSGGRGLKGLRTGALLKIWLMHYMLQLHAAVLLQIVTGVRTMNMLGKQEFK